MKPLDFDWESNKDSPVAIKKTNGRIIIGKIGEFHEGLGKVEIEKAVLVEEGQAIDFLGDLRINLREIADSNLISDLQHEEYVKEVEEEKEEIGKSEPEDEDTEEEEVPDEEEDEEEVEDEDELEDEESLDSEVAQAEEEDEGINVRELIKKVPDWGWIGLGVLGLYFYGKKKEEKV